MFSNTHFSIAVHILSSLARHEGELLRSENLAETVRTNPSFLRGLIGQLKDAGLVETQLGKGGGVRLKRHPSKITLHDVYLATEAKPALKTHPCDSGASCPVAAGMEQLLSHINFRVEHAVTVELRRVTLAELLEAFVPVAD